MIDTKKDWYFRGGRGWYFDSSKPRPKIQQTPKNSVVANAHPRFQERIEDVNNQEEIANRQRRLKMFGFALLAITGAAISLEVRSDRIDAVPAETQSDNPYYPCEFSEEVKQEYLQLGEGLGSLAVRTVEGVNWGICDDEAALWIRAHNPRLVNGYDTQVLVPESVTIQD